jgi:hypothetical protein
MRLLRAFAIAFMTALAGMFIAIFAGDYLTRLYRVSDFEGQRGYAVIFLCAPLGIIAGFIAGLVVALRSRRPGLIGFLATQGLSILLTCILAGLLTGILYLAADKPPTIDGKQLTLDFELRIPPTIQLPNPLNEYSLHASLYSNDKDNRYIAIDPKTLLRSSSGYVTISGTVALLTHSANRSLLASVEGQQGASEFIQLNLPAAPRNENEMWSDWILATQRADLTPVPEAERISVRYRVRKSE